MRCLCCVTGFQIGQKSNWTSPGLTPRGVRLRGTGEVAVREIALDRTLSGEVIVTVVPADHGVPWS